MSKTRQQVQAVTLVKLTLSVEQTEALKDVSADVQVLDPSGRKIGSSGTP